MKAESNSIFLVGASYVTATANQKTRRDAALASRASWIRSLHLAHVLRRRQRTWRLAHEFQSASNLKAVRWNLRSVLAQP